MSKLTPRSKAIVLLQKLRRLEEADDNGYCRCVSCGCHFHWKNGDGGHFIAKGHSSFWALEKVNINPQCKGCNGFGMKYGTAESRYTLWMVDKHGREFVDAMEKDKKTAIKIYKKDYEEMIAEFKEQIKFHEKRVS